MDPKSIRYYLVDVFTDVRFGGNQLAVFIDFDNYYDEDAMLRIAKELNLAEITFVKAKTGNNKYHVRIFTTEYEVPFAGHPSLGTAYIIAKNIHPLPTQEIILALEAGDIPISISDPGNLETARFTMQQKDPRFLEEYHAHGISNALQIDKSTLDPKLPIQRVNTGLDYIIIPLISLNAIRNLDLHDQTAIEWLKDQQLHKSNSHSGRTSSFFFITSETTDPHFDFHVRMFCVESDRLVEDAATGSANCCFLAYLLRHRHSSIKATIEQGVAMGRPSTIFLEGSRNNNSYTLNVGGQVVSVAEGEWII